MSSGTRTDLTMTLTISKADKSKRKLCESIESFEDAKSAFQGISAKFKDSDLNRWLREEAEALKEGGNLLQRLYLTQIEKSQVPTLAQIADGLEKRFETQQLAMAKTTAIRWLLKGIALERLQFRVHLLSLHIRFDHPSFQDSSPVCCKHCGRPVQLGNIGDKSSATSPRSQGLRE